MDVLLAFLLLAAVLAVLAYPLYQSRPRALLSMGGTLSDLLAQRDGLYATLHDLDLDYELGKLDGEDYNARREKYLSRAALVLHQLDELHAAVGPENTLSEDIEREVAALRQQTTESKTPPSTEHIKPRSLSARVPSRALKPGSVRSSALTCPNCGRAYNEGDRYCARCGQTLT